LLFTAATTLPQQDLEAFLHGWRNKLINELLCDPHGLLKAKHPMLVQNIPPDFPKLDVLHLYTCPVTSWSENGEGPDTASWTLRQLNLAKLAVLCEKSFSWGSAGIINDRFQKNVWPAAVMRMLLKVS
jgi:Holliday junction resolvase YEN1